MVTGRFATLTFRLQDVSPPIVDVSPRDVNFVFFQKSIIVLKKIDFFSIIEFGRRYLAMPWAVM